MNDQAAYVLSRVIDSACWDAAADVARWQLAKSRRASPLRVLKYCIEHRARPEVVLALTLGVIQRAHLLPGRRAGTREGDYVCVHEDATILDTRDPALCAALAIWLMEHPAAVAPSSSAPRGV